MTGCDFWRLADSMIFLHNEKTLRKLKEHKVAIRRFSKLPSLLLSISKMHLIISVERGFFS